MYNLNRANCSTLHILATFFLPNISAFHILLQTKVLNIVPRMQTEETDQSIIVCNGRVEVVPPVNGAIVGDVVLLTVTLVMGIDPFVVLTGSCWNPPYGAQVLLVTWRISVVFRLSFSDLSSPKMKEIR